jgi:hypothetical protein
MWGISRAFFLSRLQMNVRLFVGDVRGNFAIMTGLLLVPLAGISGLALDHWAVSTAKSEIENAADAAALAIINRATAVMRASGNERKSSQEGRNAGNDQFDANVGKIPDTKIIKRTTTLSINGLTLESKIVWSAKANTRFSSLFNWKRQDLQGVSSAAVTLPSYIQIHILVDNSGSMGIGATEADQKRMFDRTSCAIACHLNNENGYKIAVANGIQTRIDVVREALISVAAKTTQSVSVKNQIKLGVYTFSNSLVPLVQMTSPESTDMKLFEQVMKNKLTLTSEGGGTDYHGVLTKFISDRFIIQKSGDGTSEAKPIIYTLFITDGVDHPVENKGSGMRYVDSDMIINNTPVLVSPHSNPWFLENENVYKSHFTHPSFPGEKQTTHAWLQGLDPNLCIDIKGRSRLLTLEIEYLIPQRKYWKFGSSQHNDLRFGWVQDNLQVKESNNRTLSNNRFRKCASTPEDAYTASTADEITRSINNMFASIAPKPPRLLK